MCGKGLNDDKQEKCTDGRRNRQQLFLTFLSPPPFLGSVASQSSMLPPTLLFILILLLLTGCLAAESYYSILGGEHRTSRHALMNLVVKKDASDVDIKKAYRVSISSMHGLELM